MKITFDSQLIEINPSNNGYVVLLGNENYHVEVLQIDKTVGRIDLKINEVDTSVTKSAYVSFDGAKRWVTINGQTTLLTKSSGAKRNVRQDSVRGLAAPMPGQVRSVVVSVGDVVKKGQTLLTMEAMKMEIRIQALKDGAVKTVFVKQGQTVEREQILIEMED